MSSVSVSIPRRITAEYSLSSLIMYSDALTARPTSTGRTPVASGSSVPVCPTFLVSNIFRSICIMRKELTPSCLSITITPHGSVPVLCPFCIPVLLYRSLKGRRYPCDQLIGRRCAHRCPRRSCVSSAAERSAYRGDIGCAV